MMSFLDLATKRYSCKKFNGQQVTKEQLDAILKAGQAAPTAKNNQPQHIYVVQSEAGFAHIDQATPCRYGAQTVLVVAYDKTNVFTYPGGAKTSGAEDAAIVATHMMLAAADIGVDTCWINFFDPAKLAAALQLPEQEEIVMFLDVGFAAPEGKPLPNHFSRKDLSETVTYL